MNAEGKGKCWRYISLEVVLWEMMNTPETSARFLTRKELSSHFSHNWLLFLLSFLLVHWCFSMLSGMCISLPWYECRRNGEKSGMHNPFLYRQRVQCSFLYHNWLLFLLYFLLANWCFFPCLVSFIHSCISPSLVSFICQPIQTNTLTKWI